MDDRIRQVDEWLRDLEGEHLEFKEARRNFEFEQLGRYCCALANEGGGRVLLGVTDRRPRRVVGSQAFEQPERTRLGLLERLYVDVHVHEVQHPDGRVLVFEVAGRPMGNACQWEGRYWSRKGDSLVPMTSEDLRSVFAEGGRDFSAEVCLGATLADLDPGALDDYRRRWAEKAGSPEVGRLSHEQILRDSELLDDRGLTYAALILFGTRRALGRHLAQAEVIFEYRSSEASGPAQERKEFRQGFFSFYEDLWTLIDKRNDLQHYQDGLFLKDIATFDELVAREAILNAVSHRDYQLAGSVFLRQYQRRLVVESPGGLPWGITLDNLLHRQRPRNRRLAEAFARCGLVERSGQGMNRMFERSIRQGKRRPDFSGTDGYQVTLTLHGQVTDPRFVTFLEQVGQETLESFSTEDFLVLDHVHRAQPIPAELRQSANRLRDLGVLEAVGRGRGVRLLLSRRFHRFLGTEGAYTRLRGLDKEQNKELLVQHLRGAAESGCPKSELQEVLPGLSWGQINRLLTELRQEGRVRMVGSRRWSRWLSA
jgi:ATP-dependent DNA helicase RecG|nr:ATP-binding protein [Methanocorpusculum sp. GPch4]